MMKQYPKHHYIPVFYLNEWSRPDGRIIKFSRPHGPAIKHDMTSPRKTGYERGLYRIPGVSDDLAEELERGFMGAIDTAAASALQKIKENQFKKWAHAERHAWVRFIVGLLIRNPENLARAKREFSAYVEGNRAEWRAEYETKQRSGDPSFDQLDLLNTERTTLWALQGFIDNKELVLAIGNMSWGMVDVTATKFRFVTSDRPVIRTDGLHKPEGHLVLPISPSRLFVAVNNLSMKRKIERMEPRDIAGNTNKQVVGNAIKYVWAHDFSKEALIRSQMSSNAANDPHFF